LCFQGRLNLFVRAVVQGGPKQLVGFKAAAVRVVAACFWGAVFSATYEQPTNITHAATEAKTEVIFMRGSGLLLNVTSGYMIDKECVRCQHRGIVRSTSVKTKTGRPARRDYHHGNLKNVLIDAAISQIATHGARALSLRELARSIGVSHASTYRHFPNKESVLATIAEQGFEELTRAMEAAARPHAGDPLEMLQATGVAYVDFGVSYPHHLQIMFGDAITCHEDYPTLVEASKKAYEVLVSVSGKDNRPAA